MKITLVTESFAPRVDEVADTGRHVAEGLLANGHELLILTSGVGAASWRGARVVRSRRLLPDNAVSTTVAGFDPDLVIALHPRVLGNLALRHATRRDVATMAIDPLAVGVRTDLSLTTSRANRSALASAGIAAELWTPGVRLEEFHEGLRDERLRAAWAKGNRVVVGHVGEVTKEKVIARLERIATLDDVRLVVFGEGEGTARLRAAGAKVTGAKSTLDLARGIASLDALVQPRKKDSAVPGVRRALASGVPVIGFDAGGTPDVVRHEHNGLLIDSERNGLRGGVRRLLAEPDLRVQLAGRARASVADRDWALAVRDLEAHAAALHVGHAAAV